jgi:hypothetical protein
MFIWLLHERRRRTLILVAAVALAAGFIFGLVPLDRKAARLQSPLDKTWRKLAGALGQTNNLAIDFVGITNQLAATREAIGVLATTRREALARADFGLTVRERVNAPFQLVDYESERGKQQDELRKLAAASKVAVAPTVFEGYPIHTADVRQPDLLWAELALVEHLLTSAIRAKVTSIDALHVPTMFTNNANGTGAWSLAEIPVRLELTAPGPVLSAWLETLPLRAEEIKAAKLPEALPDKPALFVDRLTVRKKTPNKPDEVSASIRVVGFMMRE